MPQRKIIHIDMDAFYASVEQRDDPSLRGRPIAVGHDGPRGVVSTASYEARPYGVRSALPSVTARRLCPELIFVPARFDVYKAVSQQIRDIFREYTELVEPLSLDEAFLDVTHERSATLVAREIKARIRRQTELTASAGVSVNKMLAKIAGRHSKTTAQVILRWHIQRNIPTVPKTVHKERMIENLDVFDFELSEKEMESITSMDIGHSEIIDHHSFCTARQLNSVKIHG